MKEIVKYFHYFLHKILKTGITRNENRNQIGPNILLPNSYLGYLQGQPICSHYRIYGICKYGPTCKFDHPVLAIPQNYGMATPALSVLDTSLISNPRGTVQPPETSLSKLSNDKLQQSDTKATEDSSKQADTTSNSIPPSSESLHDQNA